jgi:hypothetical protein
MLRAPIRQLANKVKHKTHKGTAKRMSVTGGGLVKRTTAGRVHKAQPKDVSRCVGRVFFFFFFFFF